VYVRMGEPSVPLMRPSTAFNKSNEMGCREGGAAEALSSLGGTSLPRGVASQGHHQDRENHQIRVIGLISTTRSWGIAPTGEKASYPIQNRSWRSLGSDQEAELHPAQRGKHPNHGEMLDSPPHFRGDGVAAARFCKHMAQRWGSVHWPQNPATRSSTFPGAPMVGDTW